MENQPTLQDVVDVDINTIIEDGDNLVLTTIDNPFNPKEDYAKWKTWDEENEYFTESLIARLVVMDKDYNDEDDIRTNQIMDKVIQEILDNDALEVYMLV